MKKRILSLLLALALACSLLVFPANAAEVLDEGNYGSLHWVLTDDGTVTISGEGSIDENLKRNWEEWGKMAKNVVIESGADWIKDKAFQGCPYLKNVTIANSVNSIGEYAFSGCNSLESISIPKSITGIRYATFMSCGNLEHVDIPDGVFIIGDRAFYSCNNLASISIPTSVTQIGDMVFDYCYNLKDVYYSGTEEQWAAISIGSNNDSLTAATIHYTQPQPAVIDSGTCGENVTWVLTDDGVLTISGTGNCTKTWDRNITKIVTAVIEPGVTGIGGFAFRDCSSLTSVTIPDSVISIGRSAFSGCSSLTSVTIPDSVTSIGDSAFSYCRSLTDVTIPDSVTSIGSNAFARCSSLTSVTIPDSVARIGDSAFWDCSSLTNVTIPDSVTSIEGGAFSGCSSLTNVTIPDSVTSIEGRAFSGCSSLTSVTIPDSITQISSSSFSNCTKLKSVTLPKSLTQVDTDAFDGTLVKDVYFGGSPEDWENVVIKSGNDVLRFATIHFAEDDSDPLEIIENPADAAFLAGQPASFTVVASGDIASYQWQVKTNSGNWKNSTAPGCTTDTMTTTATAARNGYQYRCIVTDADGNSVTSEAATLTIAKPVEITGSPSDNTGKTGRMAGFIVEAEGAGLTYQWEYSDDNGVTWNASGSTSAVAVCRITPMVSGRLYRCVVTDQFGNSAASDSARLICSDAIVITTQPVDFYGVENSTASFVIEAVGEGLTYQWQFTDSGTKWANSSVKKPIYASKLTAGRDRRMVRCVITDQYGNSVTSEPAVMRIAGPVITTQPQNYVGKVNSTAKFTVAAEGDGLTYQWQTSIDGVKWSNSSVKNPSYSTKLTASKNNRMVRCIVTDQYDNAVATVAVTMKIG